MSPKGGADGSLNGGDTLTALSYGAMLVAGSLLGFGTLVSLGSPHPIAVAEVAVAETNESHAAPPAHAEHAQAEPVHHEEPHHEDAHHEAPAHHEATHHEAAQHGPDPTEGARTQARETFTDKYMSRFLSTDCDKNRHSETGVQFGINSYSEFTDQKRTRYVEGEYRFIPGGFKLIANEESQLEFKMTDDTLAMASVMVAGVVVPATPDLKWKACRSDIHEPPVVAPKVVPYDPSDGLRLALAANDMEAVTHYLALGGYIPANDFTGVVKAANLDGPVSAPIRESSRLNEENALRRKAELELAEAKRKAAEAELAKHPKPQGKEKGKEKEKEKHGGH